MPDEQSIRPRFLTLSGTLAVVLVCTSPIVAQRNRPTSQKSTAKKQAAKTGTAASSGQTPKKGTSAKSPLNLSAVDLAKWYPLFDADGNGRLESIEKINWERFMKLLPVYINKDRLVQRFDRNRDGRLAGREKDPICRHD